MARTARGRAQKLYYNTGTTETPVWSLLDIVKDVKYTATKKMSDTTVRRHGVFSREEGVLVALALEFDLKVSEDFDNTGYLALRNASMDPDNEAIEFALANKPIATAGTKYLRAVCAVSEMGEEQPIEDAVKINFKAVLTDSAAPPAYVTVPGP